MLSQELAFRPTEMYRLILVVTAWKDSTLSVNGPTRQNKTKTTSAAIIGCDALLVLLFRRIIFVERNQNRKRPLLALLFSLRICTLN